MTVLNTLLVIRIRRGPVRGNPQRQHEDCVAEVSSSPAHKVKKRSQSWLTQGAGTWRKRSVDHVLKSSASDVNTTQ